MPTKALLRAILEKGLYVVHDIQENIQKWKGHHNDDDKKSLKRHSVWEFAKTTKKTTVIHQDTSKLLFSTNQKNSVAS
jgi:hypothetical protein